MSFEQREVASLEVGVGSLEDRRRDSLGANGPAWHDRFPGLAFDDLSPDAFAPNSVWPMTSKLCR